MTTRKAAKANAKRPAKEVARKAKALQDEARRDAKLDPRSDIDKRDAKIDDLQKNTEDSGGEFLTTNQGVGINDNQNGGCNA